MKRVIALILFLLGCNAKFDLGRTSEAQGQTSGGGLRVVRVLDGGVCSGLGTKSTPLNCELTALDGDAGVHGTGSAGDPLTLDDGAPNILFGDGSDGDLVVSVNGAIPGRDTFYDNLTVNEGVFFYAGGYRLHVRGTLTLNGIIYVNGNNGVNGPDGANTVASCSNAAGGIGCCGGYYPTSGGAGGAGNVTPGTGGTTSASLFSVGIAGGAAGSTGAGNSGADRSALQGAGGPGGSGGGHVGVASSNGGNGGGATQFTFDSSFGGVENMHDFLTSAVWARRPAQGTKWNGSGGGGGGGSCGKETINTTLREPSGGGGGGSAGMMAILARRIVIGPNGGFQARGGRGGNGGSCGTHTGDAGGGGGGGGGSGGTIMFVLGGGTMPDDSRFDVSGGEGGTGGIGCPGGQNGGDGGHGGPGAVFKYRADGLL